MTAATYYSTEMRGDNEYPIYVRSKDFSGTDKQILLNVNELAEGKDYYSVGSLEISPDDAILAYSEDTVSRRMYEIKLKDMKTGELLRIKSKIRRAILSGVTTDSIFTT